MIKELKLDLRSDAEKLGMSKDGIKALKKAGANEAQIINLALKIKVKEYSEEELLQIAELEATKRGFSISRDARAKLQAVCHAAV